MSIPLPSSTTTLRVAGAAIPQFMGRSLLHPVRLSGTEGINSLFAYELLLKTPDSLAFSPGTAADFNLDDFVGREVSCEIELDGMGAFEAGAVGASVHAVGSGIRQINALVTGARMLGEEGRHILYQLTLRPWLYLATCESDCRIFQNKTVVDVLDEVLSDYPFPVEKRLYETYPVRDYQNQFNENNFAFFERLCQEWGLSYHFEHGEPRRRQRPLHRAGCKCGESAAGPGHPDRSPGGTTRRGHRQ